MRGRGGAVAGGVATVLAACFVAAGAFAQLRLPPAQAPCSVLSGHPCHPAFCGVFHRGPCFPEYPLPFGETLQLTIVSTDANSSSNMATGTTAPDQSIETIEAMFDALRACWVPPPKDKARHGMQYTVRFAFKRDGELIAPPRRTYSSHDAPANVRELYGKAVDAALARCTPLHFSKAMGEAIAGRPIAVRVIDDRTIDETGTQP